MSDQPLLAVRIAIYDPQKQEGSEPRIDFAVLGNWRIGQSKAEGLTFRLAKHMLRRIPRGATRSGNLTKGTSIDTGAVARIEGAGNEEGSGQPAAMRFARHRGERSTPCHG